MAGQETWRDIGSEAEEGREARLAPTYRKSWALVVGISDYGGEHSPLPNARRDAEAFCDLLRTVYGFDEVDTLYDSQATDAAILSWLRDKVTRATGSDDRVLFYFAGHGTDQVGPSGARRGFLIPVNAKHQRFGDYIDMQELHNACGYIKAKHVLFILDCCFSGVAAICSRSEPAAAPDTLDDAYLHQVTSRKAWQIMTAGASDEFVADRGLSPEHSPFTGSLLAGLRGDADENQDRLITATELATWVRPLVIRQTAQASGRGQTPFFNYLAGSEQGDFVFRLPLSAPPRPALRPLPAPAPTAPPKPSKDLKRLLLSILATLVVGYLAGLLLVGYLFCSQLVYCGGAGHALAWLVAGLFWLVGGVLCWRWWRRQ